MQSCIADEDIMCDYELPHLTGGLHAVLLIKHVPEATWN